VRHHPADDGQCQSGCKQLNRHHANQQQLDRHQHERKQPPDSEVSACQNQNAMAINIGLQPVPCPPSAITANGN